jgi:hypothetical protein
MNRALLTDPVVLISAAVIFIGIFTLFWAIGKFKSLGAEASDKPPMDDLLITRPSVPDVEIRPPEFSSRAPEAPAPAVDKDVADRLETMSARLAEMQTVLLKQSAAPTVGSTGAPGGVGQGFSPETIDKLLKIIGNVIQQVDVLQKSLNLTK